MGDDVCFDSEDSVVKAVLEAIVCRAQMLQGVAAAGKGLSNSSLREFSQWMAEAAGMLMHPDSPPPQPEQCAPALPRPALRLVYSRP